MPNSTWNGHGLNASAETDDLVTKAFQFAFQGVPPRQILCSPKVDWAPAVTENNEKDQKALSSSINDQQDKGVPSPPVDNNHFSFHPTPFHREISCTPLSIDLLGKEFGLNESNCIVDLLGEQFDLNESNCIINPLPSALTATREENLNFAEGELLGGCFSKKISVSP
jgi:hypothetical protein